MIALGAFRPMHSVWLGVSLLVAVTEPSAAVDYRWRFYTAAGGTSNAEIRSKDGSGLLVSCAAMGNRGMEISLTSPLLPSGSTDIQIVVGSSIFHFQLDDGRSEIGTRLHINELGGLVDALAKTKENQFLVELPAVGKSISFSTLDATKNLTGILDGCIGPIKPAQHQPLRNTPSSGYPAELVGTWGGRAEHMGDDRASVARVACETFRKGATRGDVLVFEGSRMQSFGGYMDYEDKNISVKQIGPKRWRIVDRHYHDGEGGGKVGYRNVAYEAAVNDDLLIIKKGKYTSRYDRCSTSSSRIRS